MESGEKSNGNKRLFDFDSFRLDEAERRLFKDGEPLPLPGKAFDLLLLLVESAGHLKTRTELIEALWPTTIVVENSLSWHIGVIRKALDDERSTARYIETVRGHGYRFIAPVEIMQAPVGQAGGNRPEQTPVGRENDPTPKAKAWHRVGMPALAGAVAAVLVVGVLLWYFVLREPSGTGARTPAPAIAVLPFENLSGDPANAYFAAGIQDTILSKLAGIGELRVISRTSTERYPSHPLNLRQVAAQLGVGAVLEGSVQKAGNRVLINVQLIDARSNDHIWAQAYTRSLADVFAVENDVATQVAAALQASLLPAETIWLARVPTHDPQAYLYFLKADYYTNQITDSHSAKDPAGTVPRAVALYRQAIARDPRFALAYARLSYLEIYSYWYEIDRTSQRLDEAERAARRALALDPDLPQAHLALGYVEYYGHRNYTAALAQFERARQSLPNDADVIGAIAYIYRRQGKWEEAVATLHQAAVLDPRNSLWPDEAGATYMILRRYAQAQQQFNRALAVEPLNYEVLIRRIWALLLSGETERARQALAEIPGGVDPQGLVSTLRFQTAWLNREPDRALAALDNTPPWVQGSAMVGEVPRSLLQAEARSLREEGAQTRHAYQDAYATLQKMLHHKPRDPDLWSALGLAAAGLGDKTKAIAAGRRATELLSVATDALDGPIYLAGLAKIYARLNDPARAVKLLDRLLAIPAGMVISTPLLELDPTWDPIRKDPGFQALLKKYEQKTPIPAKPIGTPGS